MSGEAKKDDANVEVLERATKELGQGAVIGHNYQYPDTPLHVGVRHQGEWVCFGSGATWDEAFKNVKNVKYQRANGTFAFVEEEKKP
jgi:hypothetical protein